VIEKVKALGAVARQERDGALPSALKRPVMTSIANAAQSSERPLPKLRKASLVSPKVLVVGSSTGGPQALFKFLGELCGKTDLPILITQHMPATFTAILGDHLSRTLNLPGGEGKDGEVVQPGHFYLAPGDHHMTVVKENGKAVIRLNQDPPENYCRPAVDQLFRSAAQVYGAATLGVMLTGMGQDGLAGSRNIADAGGTILAQDEETSVVWGMPGAVANAGLASAILPLPELGGAVCRLIRGERL